MDRYKVGREIDKFHYGCKNNHRVERYALSLDLIVVISAYLVSLRLSCDFSSSPLVVLTVFTRQCLSFFRCRKNVAWRPCP